jgi:hypothetical protein
MANNPIYHYKHRYDSKQPWKRGEVFAGDYDTAAQRMMKRHPDMQIDLEGLQDIDSRSYARLGLSPTWEGLGPYRKHHRKVWRPSRKRLLRPRARNASRRKFGSGSVFPLRSFGVWMSGGKTRTVKAHTANEAAAKAAGGPVIGVGGGSPGPWHFTSAGGRGNSIKVWEKFDWSRNRNPRHRKEHVVRKSYSHTRGSIQGLEKKLDRLLTNKLDIRVRDIEARPKSKLFEYTPATQKKLNKLNSEILKTIRKLKQKTGSYSRLRNPRRRNRKPVKRRGCWSKRRPRNAKGQFIKVKRKRAKRR